MTDLDLISAVILNNTHISNDIINERYTYASNPCHRKNVFDKDTIIHYESQLQNFYNPDELKNYDGKNLWQNFWYLQQEQPWQISVTPEEMEDHFWFRQKLYSYASDFVTAEFIFVSHKDIVDSVCHKITSDNEDSIKEALTSQINIREIIKKYYFSDIVYIDND